MGTLNIRQGILPVMSESLLSLLLPVCIVLPLLLSAPMIRRKIPHGQWFNPLTLSLVPTIVVFASFTDTEIDLPWLFFSTGLAIDSLNRWLIALLIVLWIFIARSAMHQKSPTAFERSFLQVALALHIAAIMCTELVAFFIYSSLLAYTIYAPLYGQLDKSLQKPARYYIVSIIIADLALFEALLLAVQGIDSMTYDWVQIAMSDNTMSNFYISMVITGFMLKAGIWPVHIWLTQRTRHPGYKYGLLLVVVLICTSLTGLLRWLPVEQFINTFASTILIVIGSVNIGYALLRLITRSNCRLWPAWGCLIYSGVLLLGLGIYFSNEKLLSESLIYGYIWICIGGIILSGYMLISCDKLPSSHQDPVQQWLTALYKIHCHTITVTKRKIQHLLERTECHWRLIRLKFNSVVNITFYAPHEYGVLTTWTLRLVLLIIVGFSITWFR